MSRTILFFAVIGGFLAGVFWRSFFATPFWFLCTLFFVAWLIFLAGFLDRRLVKGRAAALFLMALSLGIFRYDISELHKTDRILDSMIGQKVEIIGMISDDPEEKIATIDYVIDVQKLIYKSGVFVVRGRMAFSAKIYDRFSYGDLVTAFGVLAKPKPISDANGEVFDYPAYLSLNGIYYELSFPSIKLISSGHGGLIKSGLFRLKHLMMKRIESLLPQPDAALLEGILLGQKKALGADLENAFRRAGVIHVVILSGYSIQIIARALQRLLAFLSRLGRFVVGSSIIFLFAIMTGASSMVMRASIMAFLGLAAVYFRRDYDIDRALAATVFAMVLFNPKILAFDSSFQISLLSVIGLVHIAPLVERKLAFVPDAWNLRETVVSTISTQFFVLPFILYQMGQFSLVAVPANLLILFCLPIIMASGLTTLALSFVHVLAAWPTNALCYFLLEYVLGVVKFFAGLKFATINVPHFSFWLALVCYMLYGSAFWLYRRHRKRHGKTESLSGVAT